MLGDIKLPMHKNGTPFLIYGKPKELGGKVAPCIMMKYGYVVCLSQLGDVACLPVAQGRLVCLCCVLALCLRRCCPPAAALSCAWVAGRGAAGVGALSCILDESLHVFPFPVAWVEQRAVVLHDVDVEGYASGAAVGLVPPPLPLYLLCEAGQLA